MIYFIRGPEQGPIRDAPSGIPAGPHQGCPGASEPLPAGLPAPLPAPGPPRFPDSVPAPRPARSPPHTRSLGARRREVRATRPPARPPARDGQSSRRRGGARRPEPAELGRHPRHARGAVGVVQVSAGPAELRVPSWPPCPAGRRKGGSQAFLSSAHGGARGCRAGARVISRPRTCGKVGGGDSAASPVPTYLGVRPE